jgi:hypothetical protein
VLGLVLRKRAAVWWLHSNLASHCSSSDVGPLTQLDELELTIDHMVPGAGLKACVVGLGQLCSDLEALPVSLELRVETPIQAGQSNPRGPN